MIISYRSKTSSMSCLWWNWQGHRKVFANRFRCWAERCLNPCSGKQQLLVHKSLQLKIRKLSCKRPEMNASRPSNKLQRRRCFCNIKNLKGPLGLESFVIPVQNLILCGDGRLKGHSLRVILKRAKRMLGYCIKIVILVKLLAYSFQKIFNVKKFFFIFCMFLLTFIQIKGVTAKQFNLHVDGVAIIGIGSLLILSGTGRVSHVFKMQFIGDDGLREHDEVHVARAPVLGLTRVRGQLCVVVPRGGAHLRGHLVRSSSWDECDQKIVR